MKLSGVMLGSEDPKALAEFYTMILGKPGWQQDDWYGYYVDGCSVMIGPHSEVKGPNQNPQRVILNFETADVQGEFARIKNLGAEVVAEPYQPSKDDSAEMWLATFADTDGNFFQLASPWKE